jgi:hypothetical protein
MSLSEGWFSPEDEGNSFLLLIALRTPHLTKDSLFVTLLTDNMQTTYIT